MLAATVGVVASRASTVCGLYRSEADVSMRSTSPAPSSPGTSSCPTPNGKAAHAGGLQGQGGRASSSATRSARISARPRMTELAQVKKLLGARRRQAAGRLRHGRPGARYAGGLKAYVANFGPGFVALRGYARADCRGRQGVQGLLQEGRRQDAGQLFDGPHRRLFRLRPARRLRLYTRYGAGVPAMVTDIKALFKSEIGVVASVDHLKERERKSALSIALIPPEVAASTERPNPEGARSVGPLRACRSGRPGRPRQRKNPVSGPGLI